MKSVSVKQIPRFKIFVRQSYGSLIYNIQVAITISVINFTRAQVFSELICRKIDI